MLSCPHCGVTFDGHVSRDEGTVPEPGDISLCVTCGEWGICTGDTVRIPTDDEYVDIVTDPDCRLAREVWVKVRAS